jgi:putative endonuclease
MKYFVYVIKSSEGYYYTGMTEDLEKRLSEHNNKTKSFFWTKRGANWEVIYFEEFDNRQEALKRERWMKSGHGSKLLKEKGLK